MAALGFLTIYGLISVVFQCKGKIIDPPDGTNLTFIKEETRKIAWSFDDDIDEVKYRVWTFKENKMSEDDEYVASINNQDKAAIGKKWLGRVEIEERATLILKNVDVSFNGIYEFGLNAPKLSTSVVTVFIAVPPENVHAVLSAKIAGLGESFTISCEANADPPPKFSIFYNNTKLISTEKTYVIPKVNSSHIGFYKCAVENAFGSKNSTSVYLRIGQSTLPTSKTSEGNKTAGTDKNSEEGEGKDLGVGAIIGIIIGVLVLVVIVVGVIWYKFKCQDKNHDNERNTCQPESTGNAPHEYATLEPPLQVTYAALDQKALKKGAGGKPASTNTPTEYAAIQVP